MFLLERFSKNKNVTVKEIHSIFIVQFEELNLFKKKLHILI